LEVRNGKLDVEVRHEILHCVQDGS